MEQQPQYSIEDLLLLKSQIEEGAKRRDLGIDPSITQFDVPRERPALTNPNSKRDDYFASIFGPLGGGAEFIRDPKGSIVDYISGLELDALETQEKLNADGRPPMQRFAENLAFGTPEYEGAEEGIANSLSLAPIRMAVSGAQNTKEGIEEGKLLKAVGGTGMVAASALPFSSKIAAQLFSTLPRGLASGGAISASPLLAEEALDSSPAYADGEIGLGSEVLGKAKNVGLPFALGMAGGGLSSIMAKTMMRNASIKAQKEMADLDRIATNRGVAQGAKDIVKNEANASYHIQKDLDNLEPIIHKYRPNEDLAQDFLAAQNKALKLNKHADTIGSVTGGATAGVGDFLVNDEYDPTRSILSILGGAVTGRAVGPVSFKNKTPNIKSDIDRYYSDDTLRGLPKPTVKPPKKRARPQDKLDKKQVDDLRQILSDKAKVQPRKNGKFFKEIDD